MKRILLAGYGNIAQAFEKVIKEQEDASSYQITTCDIKDGYDIIDYLPQHKGEFDVVINTSLANSTRLSLLCAEMKIDYIDVGIEDGIDDEVTPSYDYISMMKDYMNVKTPHSRMLLGFGINPGILEHIYQKYKPQSKHYTFEMEHDDAVSKEYKVFATWSPFMYVEESIFSENIVCRQDGKGTHVIEMDKQLSKMGGAFTLNYHGEKRKYVPVCHEELVTMILSDPNLLGTAYLFQAPKVLQQYCLDKGKLITQKEALSIPVLDNLQGEDQVGMLFWDLSDNIYWIKNVMANQATWKRYGINAVCWQTAVGLWIGYKMMDKLPCNHPHTMTEVSQLYGEDIDRLLEQVGMHFEREDHVFDVEEFKENIIRYIDEKTDL